MRAIGWSVLIFSISGLVGPIVRLLTWPPSPVGSGLEDFVYDFVLLLWPAQPFAAMEVSIGRLAAISLAVGLNVALFAVAGLLAGFLRTWRPLLFGFYVVVCGMVVGVALWLAGFTFAEISFGPLLVALIVYAVPFFITAQLLPGQREPS